MKQWAFLLMTACTGCLIAHAMGSADDQRATSAASSTTVAQLCAASGRLDMKRANALRDVLGLSSVPKTQLLAIDADLKKGSTLCLRPMHYAEEAFLIGLYVMLGDQLLASHELGLAREALDTADGMYQRQGKPNYMWLHSLESAARVEIGSHDLEKANQIAARQTALARSWVDAGFEKSALIRALEFQAYALELKNDSAQSEKLLKEAANLKSGES